MLLTKHLIATSNSMNRDWRTATWVCVVPMHSTVDLVVVIYLSLIGAVLDVPIRGVEIVLKANPLDSRIWRHVAEGANDLLAVFRLAVGNLFDDAVDTAIETLRKPRKINCRILHKAFKHGSASFTLETFRKIRLS
jgi:hypothetical protein